MGLIGGVGSGKSFGGALWAIQEIQSLVTGKGIICAPTFPMLRNATLPVLFEAGYPFIRERHLNKQEWLITIPVATLPEEDWPKILCLSGDKPDRLRGPSASWLWIDEGAYVAESAYDRLLGRLREKQRAGRICVTTTPCGRNWVWKVFGQGERDGRRIVGRDTEMVRAETWENPFLDDVYILDLIHTYSGDFARQELEGHFVAFAGTAIPIEAIHEVRHEDMPDPKSLRDWTGSIDDGFVGPRAAYLSGVSGSEVLHVYPWGEYEYYRKRELPADFWDGEWKAANERRKVEAVYADPSAVELIEEGERRGVPIMRANNERIGGLRLVRNLFELRHGRPQIQISDRCSMLISELGALHHRSRKAPGTGETIFEEDVEKMNDHGYDALRYRVASTDGGGTGIAVARRRRRAR